MVNCVANISAHIESTITSFWEGITTIDPDKLVIDGDNILMLYLYIVLRARIPNMFAYIKMMDEFSTTYVRSISRYGYCLSTLEIAMERITNNSLKELIRLQRQQSIAARSVNYKQNMRESFRLAGERAAGSQFQDREDYTTTSVPPHGVPQGGHISGVKKRSSTVLGSRNYSVS